MARASVGSEEGAALIRVMGFGALTMVLVLGIAGRVVAEARAVEDSLTQVRASWSAQGLSNYILSRAPGAKSLTAGTSWNSIPRIHRPSK